MNYSKIVTTKRTSAIFLTIVLIAGTITALSYPSFMIIGSAQAQSYYNDGMDNNIYKKSYGYDTYYKPQYPSYDEKDDREKSKDSSNVINKIKCTTNNINVNGDITGDVNLGNKGAGEEGYLGSYSSDGGYGSEGYSKQDKGIECIINNNNNNTNVVVGAGGNVTDGNTTNPCIECILENLTSQQEIAVVEAIQFLTDFSDLKDLCEFLADETINPVVKDDTLTQILLRAEVPRDTIDDIRDCLNRLGFDIFDPPGLSSSPTPTRLGLSNLPTIAQGIEEDSSDLTATEKLAKLKQQWIELLP